MSRTECQFRKSLPFVVCFRLGPLTNELSVHLHSAGDFKLGDRDAVHTEKVNHQVDVETSIETHNVLVFHLVRSDVTNHGPRHGVTDFAVINPVDLLCVQGDWSFWVYESGEDDPSLVVDHRQTDDLCFGVVFEETRCLHVDD